MREKLTDILADYFNIGDSYHFVLVRTKEAFGMGTMGLEDFREYDEDDVTEIAEHLIRNGVTIQKWIPVSHPPKCTGTYLVNIHQENDIDGEIVNLTLEAWYKTNDLLFHNPKEIGWHLLHEWYELSDQLRPYITHWTYWPSMPAEEC